MIENVEKSFFHGVLHLEKLNFLWFGVCQGFLKIQQNLEFIYSISGPMVMILAKWLLASCGAQNTAIMICQAFVYNCILSSDNEVI